MVVHLLNLCDVAKYLDVYMVWTQLYAYKRSKLLKIFVGYKSTSTKHELKQRAQTRKADKAGSVTRQVGQMNGCMNALTTNIFAVATNRINKTKQGRLARQTGQADHLNKMSMNLSHKKTN